ncbi:MAG: Sensor protein [uncultured bacterium]|nr:MAG: Sensor protein [uncultured bacterium]
MTDNLTIERAYKDSKILIVDDKEANLLFIKDLIKSFGFRTVTAKNGRQALEKIDSENPDLVLLDIMMPEMDGFEVLKQLKQKSILYSLPVVVISAIDDMENIAECIKLGATDYLVKPFHSVLLKARIENCLERRFWEFKEKVLFEQLSQSCESLKRLDEARNSLVSIIVHDLNNPLSTIKGYSQYLSLKNKQSHLDPQELAKHISKIGAAVSDMEILIKSILDVAKFESEKMSIKKEEFDVISMIKDVYEGFQFSKGESREFKFSSDKDSLIMVNDSGLLSRVVQNLLINAFKYTPSNSIISIDIKINEGLTTIIVTDNGYGIPEKLLEKIFEKFMQTTVKAEGRKYGVGLGLYFCKIAVEAMGGKIRVESQEGKGCSFFIELPIKNS